MKKIEIVKGVFAIVDENDFKYLNRFSWVLRKGNEVGREFFVSRKSVFIPMWKFIVKSENNKKALFKNRNPLDNRASNIMVVPAYIASHHARKKEKGNLGKPTSKYKGVCYTKTYKGRKKWITDIKKGDIIIRKRFLTESEAANFYNQKAKELYGVYAYQNEL